MVKNSFTCDECNKSYLKSISAVACEKAHEVERKKNAELIEKNKKMVFSSNVEVRKEDLEDQFGGVKIYFKEKCDLIILMGNSGTGLKPYQCLLPHQVYVRDLRETFEENDFEVIKIVGVMSKDVFPIAYRNDYGFQRWKESEPKNDTLLEDKKEFESLDHIAKTSTGTMKEIALKDKRYLELKQKFALSEQTAVKKHE